MPESIEEAKERLRSAFLGQGGIHGFGLSRARQQIKVYLNSGDRRDRDQVLQQVQESAKPFGVEIIEEERPRLT